MNKGNYLCIGATSFALAGAQAALVSTINPLGRTLVSTPTNSDTISATDFQSLITTTADTSKAGVFDAETASGGNFISVETDAGSADITISNPGRYGRNDSGALTAGAPTSGGRFGFVATNETWNLGGTVPGEVVTHFGITHYNWDSGSTLVSVVATFTDNSTFTYNSTASTGDYGFVGIKAPNGLGIQSFRVNETGGGNWMPYDDISFVVSQPVPEPSGVTLLGFAACGFLLRRKR